MGPLQRLSLILLCGVAAAFRRLTWVKQALKSLARLIKQDLEWKGRDPSPAGPQRDSWALLLAPVLNRGWPLAPQPC